MRYVENRSSQSTTCRIDTGAPGNQLTVLIDFPSCPPDRTAQARSGTRDDPRRLLIRDQANRDTIAERLLRRRTAGADYLAELIDFLSLDSEARRRIVRVLGS
jgi:hypothetical protein